MTTHLTKGTLAFLRALLLCRVKRVYNYNLSDELKILLCKILQELLDEKYLTFCGPKPFMESVKNAKTRKCSSTEKPAIHSFHQTTFNQKGEYIM
jgi:hypothetical protein